MTRLAIVESDAASAVDLVTDGRRWGVQLSGVDLRWHASKIEASKEYLRHVAADRELDKTSERKPSAGWTMRSRSWWLKAAGYLAQVKTDGKKPGRWSVWLVCPNAGGGWTEVRGDDAPSIEAAQLAAEDALLAIAAEIVGAVGR